MLKKADTSQRKPCTGRATIMRTGARIAAVGFWGLTSLTLQAAITLDISGATPAPPPTRAAASDYVEDGLPSSRQSHSPALGSLVHGFYLGGGAGPFEGLCMSVHTPNSGALPTHQALGITHNGEAPANVDHTALRDRTAGAYLWNVGASQPGAETLVIWNDLLTEGTGNETKRIFSRQIFARALPEATTVFAGAGALALLLFGAGIHPRRSTVLHIGR